MKKAVDYALSAALIALLIIGLLGTGLLTTIVIKEMLRKPVETHQLGEFECSSDCKQMPDFTVECQCHPIK